MYTESRVLFIALICFVGCLETLSALGGHTASIDRRMTSDKLERIWKEVFDARS